MSRITFSLSRKLGPVSLALLILAVLACGGSNRAATSTGGTSIPTAISSAGEQATMAQAAASLRSYRATLTIELLPSLAIERGSFETILPDRSHFALTVLGPPFMNEMIIIGSNRYAKIGETWMKLPPGGGLPRVLTTTGGLNQLEAFRKAAEAGSLDGSGSDSVDGKKCQIYSHSIETNRFEYCVADNLPLRMKVMGTNANITFLFAEYNQVQEIKAPN
jgi:hypothetical protein